MNMAQQASETDFLGPMPEILGRYLPVLGQEDLRGFEWYYWWRQSHRFERSLEYNDTFVWTVALSPGGKTVAAAGAPVLLPWQMAQIKDPVEYPIKTWDVASGSPKTSFSGHARGLLSVAFSADGQMVASAGGDDVVKLWSNETGELVADLPHKCARGLVNSVAFFPDGNRLVSANNTIRIWEVESAELVMESETGRDINDLAVSPDSTTLAVVRAGGRLEVWDVPNGRGDLAKPRRQSDPGSNCIAFSVDGTVIATGGSNQRASVCGTLGLWSKSVIRCGDT